MLFNRCDLFLMVCGRRADCGLPVNWLAGGSIMKGDENMWISRGVS
jgi:hypothetical protein